MAQRGDAAASRADAQKHLPALIKILKEKASLGEFEHQCTFHDLTLEIPALSKKDRSGEGVLSFMEETARLLGDLGLDASVRKMNSYTEHNSLVIEWGEMEVATGVSGTA